MTRLTGKAAAPFEQGNAPVPPLSRRRRRCRRSTKEYDDEKEINQRQGEAFY